MLLGLFDVLKQERGLDLQRSRQEDVLIDSGVRLASLHAGDLGDSDAGLVGEGFLRQFSTCSLGLDVPADLLQHFVRPGLAHPFKPRDRACATTGQR